MKVQNMVGSKNEQSKLKDCKKCKNYDWCDFQGCLGTCELEDGDE